MRRSEVHLLLKVAFSLSIAAAGMTVQAQVMGPDGAATVLDGQSQSFSVLRHLLSGGGRYAVGLPGVSADLRTNFISLGLLEDDFSKDASGNAPFLDESEKRRILDLFSEGTGNLRLAAVAHLFTAGMRIGDLALVLSAEERIFASAALARDAFDLAFFGNEPGRTYSFDGTEITAAWMRQFSIAAGGINSVPGIGSLRLYGRVGYLSGFAFLRTRAEETRFFTADSDYSIRTSGGFVETSTTDVQFPGSPRGGGWGFDFLVELAMKNAVTVAAGVVDVGRLVWDKGVEQRVSDGHFILTDLASKSQGESLDSAYRVSDPQMVSERTALPARLIVRGSWEGAAAGGGIPGIGGRLGAGVGLSQTLSKEGLLGEQTLLHAFVEWEPAAWIGIGVGGSYSSPGGAGLITFVDVGTSTFHFQVGTKNALGLFAARSALSASLATSLLLTF
ncbi:MAG: hypothetical protein COS95_08740 [Ignavibacteriales bacterium CG07_land_8_20_14_0_80_59_12]|nr:MAG: hypothetical protein COS95_08740 [Ignavibacteriales bacterium CG07_land_8_20_14_0_80_59_12]